MKLKAVGYFCATLQRRAAVYERTKQYQKALDDYLLIKGDESEAAQNRLRALLGTAAAAGVWLRRRSHAAVRFEPLARVHAESSLTVPGCVLGGAPAAVTSAASSRAQVPSSAAAVQQTSSQTSPHAHTNCKSQSKSAFLKTAQDSSCFEGHDRHADDPSSYSRPKDFSSATLKSLRDITHAFLRDDCYS